MKKITLLFTLLAVTFGFAQNGGNDCASAVAITPGSFTDTTIQGNGTNNDGDAAWFSYTASGNGFIDISVCDDIDQPDTRLFIYSGDCTAPVLEATDDDGCAGSFASVINGFIVASGTEYLIQWDDRWEEAPFDWTLTYTSCVPATASAAIVDDCGNSQYTIDVDVTDMGNSASLTISNDFDANTVNVPAIGMYPVGPFPIGTAVNITLAHESNPSCDIVGGPFIDTCPPGNDTCATATSVTCGNQYAGSTVAATIDAVGDCGSVDNDAPNVFYTYVGTGTPENVTVSLCGSGYDTSIAVFTGACGALACYANNDDSCALQSEVTFLSDGTTTYTIMIEGWNLTSTGAYILDVSCVPAATPPANDTCATAEALTVGGGPVAGDNTNATSNILNPSCDAFGTISDVWYSFVAPSSGDVDIETIITTADQANVAVYDDCLQTTEFGCSQGNGGESFTVTGLTSGLTYYLQVWNDPVTLSAPPQNRAQGTFTVEISENTLSVGNFEINGFEYFPNPVNDKLSLRAQSNIQNISVFNILGQEVMRMAPNAVSTDVDMSELSEGAYFVNISINDTTETIKIIKR